MVPRIGNALGLFALMLLAACGEDDRTAPLSPATPMPDRLDVDSARIANGRYDNGWWNAAERDRVRRVNEGDPAGRDTAVVRTPPVHARRPADTPPPESFDDIAPATVRSPARLPVAGEDAGPSVARIQILLDRAGFSPGIIDGRWGKNTAKAVYWFQHAHGLEPSGSVNGAATYRALERVAGSANPVLERAADGNPVLTVYRVREDDVDGPFVQVPPGIYAMAELDCLCYESSRELLAEAFHVTPELLSEMNPGIDLRTVEAGTPLVVPNVREDSRRRNDRIDRIDHILVSREGFYTHALNAAGEVVYHFPSTVGSRYSPSPGGRLLVTEIVPTPIFHFVPTLYYDVPDRKDDATLPPGPNSPIGVVWMQLSMEHYGIHGTAAPTTIGYVTSHGCIRLTNWDARLLAERIEPGIQVRFIGGR